MCVHQQPKQMKQLFELNRCIVVYPPPPSTHTHTVCD